MTLDTMVTKRIADLYPSMSKGHKKVAEYVLANRHRAAFLTLEQLAVNADVSRGTAERFTRELGFSGYPDFRRAMAELIQESLASGERLLSESDEPLSPHAALRSVLGEDIRNLERTLESVSDEQFARVVELIATSRRVGVVGMGVSSYLAGFFAYRLGVLRADVTAIQDNREHAYRQLYWMNKSDVLVAIALPRYSRLTIELSRYAREKGAKVISITDQLASPMYDVANETLLGSCNRELMVSSPTFVMSLVDAIVTAVALRDRSQLMASSTRGTKGTKEFLDVETWLRGETAIPNPDDDDVLP